VLGSSGSARCALPALLARLGRHQPAARAGERFAPTRFAGESSPFGEQHQQLGRSFSAVLQTCGAVARFPWLARGRRGKLALMACHEVLLHQPPNRFIERTANGGRRLYAPSGSVAPSAAAHVER
jgi:hypothetical protein